MKAVELLRIKRIPDLHNPHNIEEITLGETNERRVNEVLEYYHARVEETKRDFIICLLAADTESVSVAGNGLRDILHGKPGQAHTVTLAEKGESGDPLPVVLMIGHVDWQINLRLPTSDLAGPRGRRLLRVSPGQLQPKVLELFRYLEVLTGVGVNEDLHKFFKVVSSLYGENLWDYTYPGIELDVLARFAGYNLVRYSLSTLNLVTFRSVTSLSLCRPTCLRTYHNQQELLL
jgi:hypothetical protein